MARVKRGVTSHAKHKKVLKAAKGFYGRRKNTIRIAKQAVEKANQYAFRDRKRRMARYNRWQNQNLYGVADRLGEEERRRERGAFFGSVHKTLSHLLWGDRIWMSRFSDVPKPVGGIPESVAMYPDWDGLKRERA